MYVYLKNTSVIMAALAMTVGCSKSSDDAAAVAPSLSSISSLPKVTGAVTANTSSSLSKSDFEAFAAATGIKLADVDDSAKWSSGENRALCELGFMTREILREAATPDKTLCYVGKMQELSKFGSVDDGQYKYFTISMGGSPSMKVKFKIVKAADGTISNYEMFTCNTSDSGATYSLQEYLSQTISGSSAVIVTKNIGAGGGNTWGASTSVTGNINSSGAWTSKVIDSERMFDTGSTRFDQKMTLTQSATSMIVSGDNRADAAGGASDFSMTMYGIVQLIGASSLQSIAFGDGSAKATMSYGGSVIGSAGMTTHWTGDNRATAGTSDYATDVAAASLRTDGGAVSVTFGSGQTWDCADTGSSSFSTADVSESDMTSLQTCDAVYGFGSGENGGSYVCQ